MLGVNNELSGSPTAYANRFSFWFFWAPVITFLLILGSFIAVIGSAIFRNIRSKLSYALISAGFILIAANAYSLFTNFIVPYINALGLDNLDSISFFSYLTAGIFLIALGFIVALHTLNRWTLVSLAGGFALIFLGSSLLFFGIAITIGIDLYLVCGISGGITSGKISVF
jgi:hypothetical protein